MNAVRHSVPRTAGSRAGRDVRTGTLDFSTNDSAQLNTGWGSKSAIAWGAG